MMIIEQPASFKALEGRTLGPSDWIQITQPMIDAFAEVTRDRQWIHCDPERAAREFPGGKTIAHGNLTLSLLMALQDTIYQIKVSRALNYGANKLRFISPVPVDSRIRLHQTIRSVEPIPQGVRVTTESSFEIEGVAKPALVVETVGLFFE
ncbi:MAG: MaoC family dehydratase [Devosia sp.]|nr:MaoC family dehydratase [Devosia sp.]